jgi:hypothetical protein
LLAVRVAPRAEQWAIVNAWFEKQKRNVWLTGIVRISNLRHALTMESRWREAATTALEFVKRTNST